MSVQVHCTEVVTRFEGRKGANKVGGELGVGGGNGNVNGGEGANGDVNSDGDGGGAGTGTDMEAIEQTQDEYRDGSGDEAGTETRTGVETLGQR